MKNPGRLLVALLCLLAPTAHASFHLWRMTELYSNADGTIQFLELGVSSDGEPISASRLCLVASASAPNAGAATIVPSAAATQIRANILCMAAS